MRRERNQDWRAELLLLGSVSATGTQFLGRRLVLFLANQGQLSALDDGTIDRHFGDVFAARDVVHDV